jgi:hypothetical protein
VPQTSEAKAMKKKDYEEDYDYDKVLFEPLEFFRLLYFQIQFVKSNKAKSLFVYRHLKNLPLTDEQLYFDDGRKKDEQLNIVKKP